MYALKLICFWLLHCGGAESPGAVEVSLLPTPPRSSSSSASSSLMRHASAAVAGAEKRLVGIGSHGDIVPVVPHDDDDAMLLVHGGGEALSSTGAVMLQETIGYDAVVVTAAKPSSTTTSPTHMYYNIAHMANTPPAVTWAIETGANGIALDLEFHHENATNFHHGTPCDCNCLTVPGVHQKLHGICHFADICTGNTSVEDMMDFLATNEKVMKNLAMIYIDGKMHTVTGSRFRAGEHVAKLLEEKLLPHYEGAVTLAIDHLIDRHYLRGAASVIDNNPKFEGRVFYTIDSETTLARSKKAILELTKISPFRTFTVGMPKDFQCNEEDVMPEALLGATNYAKGVLSMGPGVWILDKRKGHLGIEEHLDKGVHTIMTNTPSEALRAFQHKGLQLAKPGTLPKAATRHELYGCDCEYHGRRRLEIIGYGGCKLTLLPPRGHACKCVYRAFKCVGELNACAHQQDDRCRFPYLSKDTCKFGGGDCGGYDKTEHRRRRGGYSGDK